MPPFIHPSAEVEPGAFVGEDTRVWRYVHIMAGARIGSQCVIGQGCFIAPGVSVGPGCRLQNNVSVYAGVTLERDVFVGPSAVFTNVKRPRAAFPKPASAYGVTHVGAGASIGANATIVCGVRVGQGALVGAGAVVTRNVPSFALVVGTPARVVGWVCACGESLTDGAHLPLGVVHCAACGRGYSATDTGELALVQQA